MSAVVRRLVAHVGEDDEVEVGHKKRHLLVALHADVTRASTSAHPALGAEMHQMHPSHPSLHAARSRTRSRVRFLSRSRARARSLRKYVYIFDVEKAKRKEEAAAAAAAAEEEEEERKGKETWWSRA